MNLALDMLFHIKYNLNLLLGRKLKKCFPNDYISAKFITYIKRVCLKTKFCLFAVEKFYKTF